MRSTRKVLLAMFVGAVFIVGVGLGSQLSFVLASSGLQSDDDSFAPVQEVWNILQRDFMLDIDDEQLMEAAIDGMMALVDDPYTFYMDPEEYRIVNTDLDGHFEGIGASVRQDAESGALIIMQVMEDSPAEASGILRNDAIVQVDGQDVTALSQVEIINRIRGQEGTPVELGILRSGEPEMLLIEVTRARIEVESVRSTKLDDVDIVYIQLSQFAADTPIALREALETHDAENSAGVILDFRGNPGGLLRVAVDVASEFLDEGVILTEQLRDDTREYVAEGNPTAPTVPLVVLVDEMSASASELVAGAFQDLDRATIIGMRTYGKGSVQTLHQLTNGGGVRITIAKWFTPSGDSISGEGVVPDLPVIFDPTVEFDSQLEVAVNYLLQAGQAMSVLDAVPDPLEVEAATE